MQPRQPNYRGEDGGNAQPTFPGFESDPDQSNEANEADEQYQNSEGSGEAMSNGFYKALFENKAAAWTAIFTCALVVFSGLLWKVTSDSNDTSTATQRAFITFTSTYMEPVINRGAVPTGPHPSVTGYRFHLPMLNSGTTPTKYSTYEMAIAIQDASPTEGTDFDSLPQAERYQFVFGPKQAYDGQAPELSLGDLEAVRAGTKHVFFWGWVVYRDIFKNTQIHLSEFCFNETNPRWATPNHSDVRGQTAVTTMPCPTHNCYDEDCKDYSKRIEGFR